ADPAVPEAASGLKSVDVFAADDRALRLTEHHGIRRVVEGAQHAGHVAYCAPLDAALAQRPCRLALEVDDHEVVAGKEELAEVIVAVDADAGTADAAVDQVAQPLMNLRLPP